MRTTSRAIVITLGVLSVLPASANVNLQLRPVAPRASPGEIVEIGLYAVSDDQNNQVVRALQVILQWDAAYLELDGAQPLVNNGPYTWTFSKFFSDSAQDGLNNSFSDGDAYYQAGANFVTPAQATPQGLLVTTFRFRALAVSPGALVHIPPTAGQYTLTQVFGDQPGQEVTGTMGSANIAITWGRLTVQAQGSCGVPGQMVTVQLRVTGLPEAINGVQALLEFDPEALDFLGFLPGDGAGSPWDAGTVVYEDATAGELTYALLLLATGSAADAVVARLEFEVRPPGMLPTDVQLVAERAPLVTKLTVAAHGTLAIPGLIGPAFVAQMGNADGDADIDLADYRVLRTCLTGSGGGYSSPDCCAMDFDRDGDVDLTDFGDFMLVFTGP